MRDNRCDRRSDSIASEIEQPANLREKYLGLDKQRPRILDFDGVALVVGIQPDFLGTFELTAHFFGNTPWLDQVQTEGGDQPAMRLAATDIFGSFGEDERRRGGTNMA